jgi:hypothetical protein
MGFVGSSERCAARPDCETRSRLRLATSAPSSSRLLSRSSKTSRRRSSTRTARNLRRVPLDLDAQFWQILGLSWSPEGNLLAVALASDESGDFGIFIVPPSGGRPRRVAPGPAGERAWSPDGRWIAYAVDSPAVGDTKATRESSASIRMAPPIILFLPPRARSARRRASLLGATRRHSPRARDDCRLRTRAASSCTRSRRRPPGSPPDLSLPVREPKRRTHREWNVPRRHDLLRRQR